METLHHQKDEISQIYSDYIKLTNPIEPESPNFSSYKDVLEECGKNFQGDSRLISIYSKTKHLKFSSEDLPHIYEYISTHLQNHMDDKMTIFELECLSLNQNPSKQTAYERLQKLQQINDLINETPTLNDTVIQIYAQQSRTKEAITNTLENQQIKFSNIFNFVESILSSDQNIEYSDEDLAKISMTIQDLTNTKKHKLDTQYQVVQALYDKDFQINYLRTQTLLKHKVEILTLLSNPINFQTLIQALLHSELAHNLSIDINPTARTMDVAQAIEIIHSQS
jgi:hypothetical protein